MGWTAALLTIISFLTCICVMAGVGYGPGPAGMKRGLLWALGLGIGAIALQIAAGHLPYALLLSAFISGAWLQLTKAEEASEKVKMAALVLTVGLGAVSVLAGFFVIAAFIFLSALAGALSDSLSASGTK